MQTSQTRTDRPKLFGGLKAAALVTSMVALPLASCTEDNSERPETPAIPSEPVTPSPPADTDDHADTDGHDGHDH